MTQRKPRFGEIVTCKAATPPNPNRHGYFVRVVTRTGRVNRGTWWELTDGNGKFWQTDPNFAHVGLPVFQQEGSDG